VSLSVLTVHAQDSLQIKKEIGKISFSGNDYYSNIQLKEMMFQKEGGSYSKDQLELDIRNIISNYQKEGFINCSIEKLEQSFNFDSSKVDISVSIKEGSKILIGEVIIEGNKVMASSVLFKLIDTEPGKVLRQETLNQDIVQLLNYYEEKGYTFASINVKDIIKYSDSGKEKLRVIISIQENEQVKIDNIVIEGNTTTNSNVILRELRIEKNSFITREKISNIRRTLDNLGYFESVEEPKIYKYKNSTVLLIKVKEGNTNTFDGILGYVPPSQQEDNGYFTGLVNLSLRNLFGTGRRLDARWQKEVKSTQELEMKYLEPWVLNFPVNMNLSFLQRIQDSTYIKRDFQLKADVLLSKYFTASFTAGVERVIPSPADSLISLYYTIFDSRVLTTGFEIRFDSRDYVYNPTRGFLYRTTYTIGQKKIYNAASFTGQDVPSDFTVQRGIIDLDIYYSFFKRQSLLLSLHGGEVISPKFENADYFRFGGNRTVRGYREEQFLASRIAWSNIELRYSLSRKSFASLFYDMGYYRKPKDDIAKTDEIKEFIFGYGLGIRVETGLGIFGISYALGKGDSMLEGKIHFGIVNDF
jgi:outer membrane protein insertion porin family